LKADDPSLYSPFVVFYPGPLDPFFGFFLGALCQNLFFQGSVFVMMRPLFPRTFPLFFFSGLLGSAQLFPLGPFVPVLSDPEAFLQPFPLAFWAGL